MLKIEYCGKEYTVHELSELSGIDEANIRHRLREDYDIEEVLSQTPVKRTIKEYMNTHDWHDWVNKTTETVYKEYFRYCIDNRNAPENKQTFVKGIVGKYPWLVPTANHEYVRKKYFKLKDFD